MSYQEFVRRSATLILMVAVAAFAAIAVWNLSHILMLVFFCWVLSVGFNSVENNLEKLGLSPRQAVFVTLIGLAFLIFFIIAVVIPPFVSQTVTLVEGLPDSVESLVERYEGFYEEHDSWQRFLPEFTVENYQDMLNLGAEPELVPALEPDLVPSFEPDSVPSLEENPSNIDVEAFLRQALLIVGGIGTYLLDILANLLVIIFITSYLIADPFTYYRPIIAIVPQNKEQRVIDVINDIREKIAVYLSSRLISITFMTVTITVVLGIILDIPNAFALGLLAGLGSLIPNVGYYIGFVPIVVFTAAADPYKVIPAVVIYWLLNELEGKFITPAIIKESLSLPAGVILPFQIIAASVFGFFGILLAVPLMIIIVTVIREMYVYDTLEKEGQLPKMHENEEGEVVLEYKNPQLKASNDIEP